MTQGPYDETPPDTTPVPDAEPTAAPDLPAVPPPVPYVPRDVSSAPVGWPSAPPPFTRSEVPPPEPEPAPEPEPEPVDPTPVEAGTADVPPEADVPEVTAEAPVPEDGTEDGTEDGSEDGTEDGTEDAHTGRGSRAFLLPVLAALALVLTGLSGYLGWTAQQTSGPAPVDASRTQALTAAREAARLVFSYDYRRLDKDFAAGKAVTTGEFAKEYARTTAKLVDDVAPRYKAVVTADVSEAGVVRASDSTVVCLVFVNQSSTSSLMPQPKVTQSRLEMTLTRTGGRWLVSSIDAL